MDFNGLYFVGTEHYISITMSGISLYQKSFYWQGFIPYILLLLLLKYRICIFIAGIM